MSTAIEWTDETWNPSTGCDRVSPGCANIERTMPFRVEGRRFDEHGRMGVRLHPERLGKPLHWRTPRRVFVNSLSDLFHPQVSVDFLAEVFAVMALSRRHTFQVLTKRPRALEVRDRCVSAGVPFFFKQWGGRWPKQLERELDGRTWDEMPAVVA